MDCVLLGTPSFDLAVIRTVLRAAELIRGILSEEKLFPFVIKIKGPFFSTVHHNSIFFMEHYLLIYKIHKIHFGVGIELWHY